jgi:nucleoside-diphosphate-sugar epimerase
MKVLFVGGSGNISTACVRLCVERGMEVFVLNRGRRAQALPGVRTLVADVSRPGEVEAALGGLRFDAVADFIAFTPADVERAALLFSGRTRQYLFVSSASAYQKPMPHPATESTPLKNPFWEYSRNKIACEDRLTALWRERDFPMVIVRPSLTYATVWPVAIGSWDDLTLVERMRRGGEVIVHGDGTSLWTVTHAQDFAKGFCGLLGNASALGHAFHITSDEVLTWDEIYTTIAHAAGVEPRLVHIPSEFLADFHEPWRGSLLGDKSHSAVFDNSKIKRFVPDYAATIPFHVGARMTLEWFEADPARRRVVPEVEERMDAVLAAWRARGSRPVSSAARA